MRFGISRMLGMLSALFAEAPLAKRSTIMARQNMRHLVVDEVSITKTPRHRNKTGGHNWLKIALNSWR